MIIKNKKFVILLILLTLFTAGFSLAKNLETDYPEVGGFRPKTTETYLPYYVNYIFNFIIAISGIIALTVIIINGLNYISSADKPEKLKEAQKNMSAALIGLGLLISSWLILYFINPALINIDLPGLEKLPPAVPEIILPEDSSPESLERIKALMDAIKELSLTIEQNSLQIKHLTNNCDCRNTMSVCACSGGNSESNCEPIECYAGLLSQPCPESDEIKELQKEIIDQKDIISYYKERIYGEKQILDKEIEVLNQIIIIYKNALEEAINKNLDESIIDGIKEMIKEREEEKERKENIGKKLYALYLLIKTNYLTEISQLPEQCLLNVKDKCEPGCKQGENYGCHNKKDGCQPRNCKGKEDESGEIQNNPCPLQVIEEKNEEIESLFNQIIEQCDKIISII